jgi:CubicO group peptidase (beta-lactamase class C family)
LSKPDLLERALGEHGLPGISAAAFDGDSVSERALGDATPDTQYLIGSITKTFVAAALVALEIDLHVPLTRYGTPAQLLSHTSGLQRELPGDAWGTLEFPDREQIVESLDEVELVLPPGRWHYSNLGYVVLGELIRERAGTPFEDVISERLLDPLGLTRTSWEPHEPYARGTNRGAPEPPIDKGGARASGGLWSTAGDLARWARHLMELDALHRPFAHAGWDEAWGLGVACFRIEGRELWGHEGSSVGYQSALLYDCSTRAGAAVLTNATQPAGLRGIAASLVPQVTQGSKRDETPPPPEVEGLLGSWWSEGVEHRFRWTGRLETGEAVFAPAGDDRYRTAEGREEGELLRVVRDASGEPVELWWAGYPFRREPGYSFGK